jgi:hypothetical protein
MSTGYTKAAQALKEFKTFLEDVPPKMHRITEWEKEFFRGLERGYKMGLLMTMEDLTPKQKEVVRKIEQKIYRIG